MADGASPRRPRPPASYSPSASSTNRQSAFASRICVDRAAVHLEQPRARDQVREAARPRDRDVQPVPREQELEPARHVLAARARHRVDDDVGLLPLELVDRADARASAAAPRASAFTCALYGATTITSRRARRPAATSRSTSARTAATSSADSCRLPVVLDRRRSAARCRAASSAPPSTDPAAAAPRRTPPRCSAQTSGCSRNVRSRKSAAVGRDRRRRRRAATSARTPRVPTGCVPCDHLRELLRVADEHDVPRRTCPSRARRRARPGRPRR